jgi:hypothetical protein
MPKAGVITIDIDAGTARFLVDMDKANAKLQSFGKGAQEAGGHTVTAMQASSAAIREMAGGSNIRAVERLISTIPGVGKALQAAFPLIGGIALASLFTELGSKAVEFFQKMQQAPERIAGAFRELNAPLKLTNDELKLANDRLANDIAKLEGKPQNGLVIAIDEARVAADKLADSLDKDLDRLGKLLKDETRGFWAGLIHGDAATADIRKELVGETGAGGFRAALAGKNGDPQESAKMLDAEIAKLTTMLDPTVMRQKFGDMLNMGPRIELLNEAIRNLRSEREHVDLTVQNTARTGKKDSLDAAKTNSQEEAKALKAGYDEMLAQYEAYQTALTSEKLEFRQRELANINAEYGSGGGEAIQNLKNELEKEIGHLSQEAFAQAKEARDKDAKDKERYQAELAKIKVDWAKKQYEAVADLTKHNTERKATEPRPEIPQTGIKGDAATRLHALPLGNVMELQKAGYSTVEEQEKAIANEQNMLAMLEKGGYAIGQQLALREKTLESQIALGIEEGKDVSAAVIALGQLQRQMAAMKASAEGWASFFVDMQNSAKTSQQIAQDGIRSAVDRLSGSIADVATGKKGNFGKDFQEIGRQMLQETIKSGLQRSLGSLGQKLGIHKPTFNIGDPGHVIVDNMPSNGSAAPGGIKPATGSGGGARPWGGPGGIFGGSAGGGIFNYAGGGPSFSSSPFGGMMAGGGDVDPGMIYGVNENGREYFQPKTAGTIIPAGQVGGGGDTHYNIDARGSTDPTLTANNVRRAILAAHADGVATSVQANAERAKRTVQA